MVLSLKLYEHIYLTHLTCDLIQQQNIPVNYADTLGLFI
jgi:hypothetical protein